MIWENEKYENTVITGHSQNRIDFQTTEINTEYFPTINVPDGSTMFNINHSIIWVMHKGEWKNMSKADLNLQEKEIKITSNGTYKINFDEDYDGLSSVNIVVDIE